jgi:hypothetical protein
MGLAHQQQPLRTQEQTAPEGPAATQRGTGENPGPILAASTNSMRGVDVLLPGNGMIRSARYDTGAGEKMRYSYVRPDGMTYDVSEIIKAEWRDGDDKDDVLEGVLGRKKEPIGAKLHRLLSKIQGVRSQ